MKAAERKRIVWVCETCGSAEVKRDAYASFDVNSQIWELHSCYDAAYCDACGGETHLISRTLG